MPAQGSISEACLVIGKVYHGKWRKILAGNFQ